MDTTQGKLPHPPGLISSLAAGFNAVANHISVILFPVLFDLFLWLGPHMHLKQLLQPFIDQIPALSKQLSLYELDASTVQQAWTQIVDQFNLFIIVRTLPVGVSSLMSGLMPTDTPLGAALRLDAGSFINAAGWALLLLFIGWLFGGFYYYWVSSVALKLEKRSLIQSATQSMILNVIWIGVLCMIGGPLLLVFSAASMINPFLAQILFFVFSMFLLWLALPVFFSPHGIFTYQQNAIGAILNSLRMVRFTLPNSGLFLIAILIINQGLDFLWRTPAENSWLSLVGVLGHAFISTSLLAASFIYYRDINAWLKEVFERIKTRTNSVPV